MIEFASETLELFNTRKKKTAACCVILLQVAAFELRLPVESLAGWSKPILNIEG